MLLPYANPPNSTACIDKAVFHLERKSCQMLQVFKTVRHVHPHSEGLIKEHIPLIIVRYTL